MENSEAAIWADRILGELGPTVRNKIAAVLKATHDEYAAYQASSNIKGAYLYGAMWAAVPQALLDEFGTLSGVERFRPRYGKYAVPILNGVPIVPWRVSKEQISALDDTALSEPVTGTKLAMFEPHPVQTTISFQEPGFNEHDMEDLHEGTDQARDLRALIDDLVGEDPHVAVLAYASNSQALLSAYFGYAKLDESNVISYSFNEKLDLDEVKGGQLRSADGVELAPAFDSTSLEELPLRPRSPLEGEPLPEPPLILLLTAEENDE